jgi:DNA-binding transcriptional LysR family regulator
MEMMELRHLRVFLALAEELHFGRTAKRLRVAQSAVSQTIRALEDAIGTTLFERTRREVRLSPAGAALIDHARATLRGLDDGVAAARAAALGDSGRLVIRTVITAALSGVPELVARYRDRYPQVAIDLAAAGTTEQLEAVRAGRCDIAIVPFQHAIEPLAFALVARGRLCAVVPTGHRYAGRRELALVALAGEGIVFLRASREPQTLVSFRKRCVDAGFEPRIVFEVDQLEMMLGYVAAGLGIACISSFVARLAFPSVRVIPLTPPIHTKICAVWDPQRLSATARRFVEMLPATPVEPTAGSSRRIPPRAAR